jgi:hypothetical protein
MGRSLFNNPRLASPGNFVLCYSSGERLAVSRISTVVRFEKRDTTSVCDSSQYSFIYCVAPSHARLLDPEINTELLSLSTLKMILFAFYERVLLLLACKVLTDLEHFCATQLQYIVCYTELPLLADNR